MVKILRKSDFRWICGKSFLELIVKQNNNFEIKEKLDFCFGLFCLGWVYPFLNDYPTPGESGG